MAMLLRLGILFALGVAAIIMPQRAGAQGLPDGSELRGATLLVESTDGTVNRLDFHPDGTLSISSPSGLVTVSGRWYVGNGSLCIEVAADRRECWLYRAPFQVGQEVVLTSDCPATARWTAQTLAAPPPLPTSGEPAGGDFDWDRNDGYPEGPLRPTTVLPPRRPSPTSPESDTSAYVRQRLARLPPANAYIAAPASVQVGERFVVAVIVDPGRSAGTQNIVRRHFPDATISLHTVPWAYRMDARLDDNASFEVQQRPLESQPLDVDGPTTWTWGLKATQASNALVPIVVRLRAHIPIPDQQPVLRDVPPIQTEISVEMSWLRRLGEKVPPLQSIYSFGALLVAGALGIAAWFRQRFKARNASSKRRTKRPKRATAAT